MTASSPLPVPPDHPRRLVYFGTPAMAVPPLVALHDAGFDIALVVTGIDKKRGRGATPSPNPVKATALDLGLPVSHDPEDAVEADADLGVVVAFGQILRRPLLGRLPMVNLHFSLLPRWRGAAPVERAILAGDDRTGVCVMAVEEGLDTGAVYSRLEVPITDRMTADELGAQLTDLGSTLLVETLRTGLGAPEPQSGEVTYASKFAPSDHRIDWTAPTAHIDRLVRIGAAWTTFRGTRFKIHDAEPTGIDDPAASEAAEPGTLRSNRVKTGDGWLQLQEIQAAGKARAPFASWANGAHLQPDERFDEDS